MAKFESIYTGNIATTPINAGIVNMSPSEREAFSPKPTLATPLPDIWDDVPTPTGANYKIGRMEVPGGYLYVVSTGATFEAMTFVPNLGKPKLTKPKTKKR